MLPHMVVLFLKCSAIPYHINVSLKINFYMLLSSLFFHNKYRQ